MPKEGQVFFNIYVNKGRSYNGSSDGFVKADSLICYDMQHMHEILTLNFFRFLDSIEDKSCVQAIYDAFEKLTPEALQATLQDIGEKITDTMEFNFYGAHLIDYSTLLRINAAGDGDDEGYPIELPAFLEALNAGDMGALKEATQKILEAFSSWRFMDYLIESTKNPEVLAELKTMREQCVVPSWMSGDLDNDEEVNVNTL